jgi:hypothetical protein
MLDPTATYRLGFYGEKGPGKRWGNFFIVSYPLCVARYSQGMRSLFWHRHWETRCFPGVAGEGVASLLCYGKWRGKQSH